MLNTLISVASLLASYALLLLGNGLFSTVLGLRARLAGFPTSVTGLVMAAYFVGLLAGALYAARVVERAGHIRAFAAFASMLSVFALLHVLLVNAPIWALLRFCSGFCMAGMIMVTESWLNERCSNENRGEVLALYMITNYLAAGCGQFLVPLANPSGFQLFSLASILYSLALIPVLLTRSAAPLPVTPTRVPVSELYRTSPLGLAGVFAAGLVNSTLYAMGPVFARNVGLSLTQTSTFMASIILGGLLLQYPVGWVSDKVDRRWVLTVNALMTAIAAALIAVFAGAQHAVLYAAAVLYGSFSFTLYSISSAHTNDFAAAPDQRVQISSGLLLVYGVGASGGPVFAAGAMSAVGPRGMFLYTGAVTALLGLFALYRMTRRAAPEERAPTLVTPDVQFSSAEIYTTLQEEAAANEPGVSPTPG